MTTTRKTPGRLSGGATLALALLLCGAASQAQPQPAPAPPAKGKAAPSPEEQAFNQTRQELDQIRGKLAGIQKEVMKGDKPLRDDEDKLQRLIEDTMKKGGMDPKAQLSKMKGIYDQLQKGGMAEEQGRKLMGEFQQLRMTLEKAQYAAMQDKQVKERGEAFQKRLEAAMIKKDPAAKELLARYAALLKKLYSMMGHPG